MSTIKGLSRVYNYVTKFGEHIFASYGDVLNCKMCEIKINGDKHIVYVFKYKIVYVFLLLILLVKQFF